MFENHSCAIHPCVRKVYKLIVILDCDPFAVVFSERFHVELALCEEERFPVARLVFHKFAQIQFDER